jgi:hypothetical protein
MTDRKAQDEAFFAALRADRQLAVEYIVGGWFLHGPAIMQHWRRAGFTIVADAPGHMQVPTLQQLAQDFRDLAANIESYAHDCATMPVGRGGVQ